MKMWSEVAVAVQPKIRMGIETVTASRDVGEDAE